MYSIGVDIGGTKIRIGVMDGAHRMRSDFEIPTQAERGPDPVLRDLFVALDQICQQVGKDNILGIGVGVPGPMNPKTGYVLGPPNLPGWTRVPLRNLMGQATGLNVMVENDANVATLAEHRYGAGQGTTDLVYFTVSTGIGGGAVVSGCLVQGHIGAAAEYGHMMVDLDGPVCRCGNRGCLEVLASGTAIARIGSECYGRPVTAAEIGQFACEGDPVAVAILDQAFDALGIGVVNVINAFDPERVVIGGGVAQLGALLFERVQRVVDAHCFRDKADRVPVVPAALGPDSGVMGAATLPWLEVEDQPRPHVRTS